MKIHAVKSARSKRYAGAEMEPHLHDDGMYVASRTRFEVDYIRVETLEQLAALIALGYSARMSSPGVPQAASLISPKSIQIDDISTPQATIDAAVSDAIDSVELDVDSVRKRRVEQALIRAKLLNGSRTGLCTICREELPENLLVAAHLKPRFSCSDFEKRDITRIAALMCTLGCDDLYEYGYIFVEDGEVRINNARSLTKAVEAAVKARAGVKVANWSVSAKYYTWHRENIAR